MMKNLLLFTCAGLLASTQAFARGIDTAINFLAPKQVACLGTTSDNSVVILTYSRDDNRLFVPGGNPTLPGTYSSVTKLHNVTLQKSNPVKAAPGYFLPVNVFLLNSSAAKAQVYLHAFDNVFWGAILILEMQQLSVQLYRDNLGQIYGTLYRTSPAGREFIASLNCK